MSVSKAHEKLIATAKQRFLLASEAEKNLREEALDDLRFSVGEQWLESDITERKAQGRPYLTVNRLPQFIRQVVNEQRQNAPGIEIHPVDDKADVDTAEVVQGMFRHIEVQSAADAAYQTAFEHAVTFGFGFIRIITDYVDPMSFDQEILIKRIKNPFAWYFDPYAQEADYSDANWCIGTRFYSEADYKAEFGDSELCSLDDFTSVGDQDPNWVGPDGIRVVEQYERSREKKTICLLADRSVVLKEKLPPGAQVVAERETEVPVIKYAKLNACEVLEESTLPGYYIPVVPVLGNDIEVNGERKLSGIVRHAKDPQRRFNFLSTAETEAIALMPKAPYIGAAGAFEGFEDQWSTANVANYPFLEYNPRVVNGELAPPPHRQVSEPAIQAIALARAQAADDLKATTGIYDPSLGAQGNETSGKAILARQREGDMANAHYVDNLARALRHVARIVLGWIPYYYDTPRIQRIIGAEDEQQNVMINAPGKDGKLIDVTTGRYDVTVKVGPSASTQRQAAVESMLGLAKAFPPLVQFAGDLMVRKMDWPGANAIADRLKKALPPGLAEEDDEKAKGLDPVKLKQMLDQTMVQHEQLTEALNVANEALERKEFETASKERIALLQIKAELIKAELQAQSKEGITVLQAELSRIDGELNRNHALQMAQDEREHSAQQADADRQAAAQQMPEAA